MLADSSIKAPVVHQFDRCGDWIGDYFEGQKELFQEFLDLKKIKKAHNRPRKKKTSSEM